MLQLLRNVANLVTSDDDEGPKYLQESTAKHRQLETHSCTGACFHDSDRQVPAISVIDVTAWRVTTRHHAPTEITISGYVAEVFGKYRQISRPTFLHGNNHKQTGVFVTGADRSHTPMSATYLTTVAYVRLSWTRNLATRYATQAAVRCLAVAAAKICEQT